ncbi:hypothetical protein Aduo_017411 [Ancylostoma duodenale]
MPSRGKDDSHLYSSGVVIGVCEQPLKTVNVKANERSLAAWQCFVYYWCGIWFFYTFYLCPLICESGCRCKEGFYRNSEDECVADCTSEPCPGPHEVRKSCGVRHGCQPTCLKNRYDLDSVLSATILVGVALQRGARECGENEEWRSCGSACEPSCAAPSFDFCRRICKVGCQCKRGFYRDSQDKCVADCSSDPCPGPNEVRKSCGVREGCAPFCFRSHLDLDKEYCEKEKCSPFECECKPGYIRLKTGYECVSMAKCKYVSHFH